MTAKEIFQLLEDHEVDVSDFAYGELPESNKVLKSSLGEWEEVAQYGGTDQGSTWYSVKHFKDHGVYIRTDGFYQSHHGTDFDEGYGKEVFPQQKTITVYE